MIQSWFHFEVSGLKAHLDLNAIYFIAVQRGGEIYVWTQADLSDEDHVLIPADEADDFLRCLFGDQP